MTSSRPAATKQSLRQEYSAPALEKAIDITDLLATAEGGLTLSEIAVRLKRSMSEIFRVIMVMERRRWLQKDPTSARYSVTYHLLELAHRGTPAQSLSLAAAPVMNELSIATRQSCHLVVRAFGNGLVIQRQENIGRQGCFAMRLGASVDLLTSCSGHVLLAFTRESDREAVYRLIPQPWRVGKEKIAKITKRVKQQGFELQPSPVTAGVTDISYPIHGLDGNVVAALTIPFLRVIDGSLPVTIDRAQSLLQKAAHRISRTLGWIP